MSRSSFRFGLERVRRLRERTEDAAKEALAGAMLDQQRSRDGVLRALDEVQRAQRAQLDAAAAPTSARELIARQAFLERSERDHRVSEERLGRSDNVVAERREALAAAARDREALDRLKANRRLDHEQEVARRETLVLDEIALNGYRRRAAA